MASDVGPRTIDELDECLSRPTQRVIELFGRLKGDVMLLGVAGKMGPTIARMAKRAIDAAGGSRRVIGVSRFSDRVTRDQLQRWGIETVAGDLLNEQFVESLPDVSNLVYMAGFKFGASTDPSMSWAMNCYVPSLVCRKFRNSRIVAFSTGNVYGMVPVTGRGSSETDGVNPVGEYAMACLGRERIFQYFCQTEKVPIALLRLNYATELRYGVLVDLAQQVMAGESIDVSMGYVNVIWQADANAMALCALEHACCPALVVNIAGPEKLCVRDACTTLARYMKREVHIEGTEASDALLSNGQRGYQLLGAPDVDASQLIQWTAHWIMGGGETLGKPTKFQRRDGKF